MCLDQRARQVDQRRVDHPRPDRVGGRDVIGHDVNRFGRADPLGEEALLASAIDHGPPQVPRRVEIAQALAGEHQHAEVRCVVGQGEVEHLASFFGELDLRQCHVGPLEPTLDDVGERHVDDLQIEVELIGQ